MLPPSLLDKVKPEELPRAKYETPEGDGERGNQKHWMNFAVGLVLANAFLSIQDAIYGTKAHAAPQDSSAEVGLDRAEQPADGQAGGDGDSGGAAEPGRTGGLSQSPGPSKIAAFLRDDSLMLLNVGEPQPPIRASAPVLVHSRNDAEPVGVGGGGAADAGVGLSSTGAGRQAVAHSDGGFVLPGPQAVVPVDTNEVGSGEGFPDPLTGSETEEDVSNEDQGGGEGAAEDGSSRSNNRAPSVTGPVLLSASIMNQAVIIGLSDFLRTATDPDGDALSIKDISVSAGTITQRGENEWLFSPKEGETGEVRFSYVVSDGSLEVAQQAILDLRPLAGTRIAGTEDGERIAGTPYDDHIDGRGGSDTILANAGHDVVAGGAGDDRIVGGEGDDVLFGDAGNDILFGNEGNDTIYGGGGDDFIDGGAGDDVILAEGGNDVVFAETGADFVSGGEGDDFVSGGEGNDIIHGDGGNDTLLGDLGNDTIIGGAGDDKVDGGGGDDLVVAVAGDGDDEIDGGVGSDTYSLAATQAPATVDLTAGTSTSAETGIDTLVGIENVIGSSGGDVIVGDEAANVVTGGAGDDLIDTQDGDDTIIAVAGDGDDQIDGGVGSDTYSLAATQAPATVDLTAGTSTSAETGIDTLVGIENVVGSSGGDVIVGDEAANVVNGGAGNDLIDTQDGDDVIVAVAGDGDDVIDGGVGNDTLDFSAIDDGVFVDLLNGMATSQSTGSDSVSSIEQVVGGAGNDTFVAGHETNVFTGGTGDDVFVFTSTLAAGYGRGARDKILDFDIGDRIDLDDISREFADQFEDALKDEGIRKFVLIKDNAAFSKPGELRISHELVEAEDVIVISGNIDFDAQAEFEIELHGAEDYNFSKYWQYE
ncbi:MAG: hypothetical protein RLZ98_2369 [Pseudomonadota bacterium]|jgi:Ca2+-binding RTX toxin-like protein